MIDIATLNLAQNIPQGNYFVDPATYTVYSHRSGSQNRLAGSVNISNVRSYTLQSTGHYPVKIREDRLKAAVAAVVSKSPQAAPSKGWIIGSVTNGCYSFSPDPVVHNTEASVNTEIERLAKNNPGTRFVKVRIEAFVQTGGVNWS